MYSLIHYITFHMKEATPQKMPTLGQCLNPQTPCPLAILGHLILKFIIFFPFRAKNYGGKNLIYRCFDPCMWLNGGCAYMQAHAWQYKSIQDTLLSNFDFLHYTQILHCLKDQWWAFGPPLWAFGPILYASVGQNDLGGPWWANPESLAKIWLN